MIIIITDGVFNNGFTQFSEKLLITAKEIGEEADLYTPIGSYDKRDCNNHSIHFFDLSGSYWARKRKAKKLAADLSKLTNVDAVIFSDDYLYDCLIGIKIRLPNIAFFIHDPVPHSHTFSLSYKAKIFLQERNRKKIFKKAKRLILLSHNSENQFFERYPAFPKQKTFFFPLGPHVPDAIPKKPGEIGEDNENYILFFGNILKYKNHSWFISHFSNIKTKLIIAGSGTLDPKSREIIAKNPHIILINRFIPNEEMIYLFSSSHCKGNLLPYLDATQSGVLVLGYSFGVPCIVSSTPGLAEFVIEGKTGFICRNESDYSAAISKVVAGDYSAACKEYVENYLSYKKNLTKLLSSLREKEPNAKY